MLGDKRFLRSIRLRNILSFGPDTPDFELDSLNVFIGPNASGKSNLIEAISLLQAAPGNLLSPIQSGGGITEWFWKGGSESPDIELEATVTNLLRKNPPLRHRLVLAADRQLAWVFEEIIETAHSEAGQVFYRFAEGQPLLFVRDSAEAGSLRNLDVEELELDESILSQRKDPKVYPELTYLGKQYVRIRLFREWNLGRNTPPRKPQPPDLPSDFLLEDASNLGLVLNDLEHRTGLRHTILKRLQEADGTIENFSVLVRGGTVQLFVHYTGLSSPVPATRLSDGTVRYLCLLSILCHPDPPPLVCLEEPELGLHPDLIPRVANLLIEASHRMQLIVTTHSDTLIDALSEVPEAVVVCEKENGCTKFRRQGGEQQAAAGLGQRWIRGEIGGVRW